MGFFVTYKTVETEETYTIYKSDERNHPRIISTRRIYMDLNAGNLTREQKQATKHTIAANDQYLKELDFDDREDFELAKRGLIGTEDRLVIPADDGRSNAWDLVSYDFLNGDCPHTVNPSLWRISQLNMIHGLFEVVPGIYQIRGYDIANITFIQGKSGWICMDPITCIETSRASKQLLDKHLGFQPISAVIYTHGHKDHFAGASGIVKEEDVASGKVPIYAPEHFLETAVSESVYAGQAMGRRSMYMYGSFCKKDEKGNVGNGIGMTAPIGESSLIAPTQEIRGDETIAIDGVTFEFQMVPNTEAQAEFMLFLPEFGAFCSAEITNATLHNLYTIRGAEIRDAKAWAYGIDHAIDLFGSRMDVIFMTHHFPRWGQEDCLLYLKRQRDMYKFLHDQTLNLANQGYVQEEIAEMIDPPPSLGKQWYNRGYHGTVSHNVKAIYTKYLGYYNGNPSTLNQLPPTEAGRKYVELMGGKDVVLEKAFESFQKGEYRWTAHLLNHLVFAEPHFMEGRLLLADTLEQLGYQSENGCWRNAYLTGAFELRNMSPSYFPDQYPAMNAVTPESAEGMTTEMLLEYLAIKLDSEKAAGQQYRLNLVLSDTGEAYGLIIENSVLNFKKDGHEEKAAALAITKQELTRIVVSCPDVDLDGEEAEFFRQFENFPFWFNIIEP